MRLGRLADRGLEALDGRGPVATHRDDRLAGADRVGGDDRALDHQVRVALGQCPIAERARIGGHQVGDHDLAIGRRATGDAPLGRGREARTATTTEPGGLDLADHPLRRQLRDRALQAGVPAVVAVAGEARRVDPADVGQDAVLAAAEDADLRREGARHLSQLSRRWRPRAALTDHVEGLLLGQRAVDQGVDPDRRADGAGADVAARLEAEAAVGGRVAGLDAELPLERCEQLVAAREPARGAVADRDHVALGREQAEAAEAGGTEDLRPMDAHPVAHPTQRAFGQVAVSLLDGTEDGDERLRAPPEAVDHLVDEGGVDLLVPAGRVAHRPGRHARAAIGVRVGALVVDLRHAVPDPVALRVEAAHVDRLDRADLRALEADLALVLAERVIDQVEAAAPSVGDVGALLGVLAGHLRREEVAEGGGHALGNAGPGNRHQCASLTDPAPRPRWR